VEIRRSAGDVRGGGMMRRIGMLVAAMALGVTMSGCGVVDDNSYSTRDGVGAKLQWSNLSEETQLLNDYVSLICQQADLVRVYRDGTIPECRPSGAEWAIFVQAGMNDIDRRCDGFLNYIDYLRRSRVHWLNQLTQTLAATSTVMGATGASAKSMEIVTAAFGLAANSLTNSTERLLTLAEHSTVQSVVLGEQRKFRIDVRTLGPQINNRPAAIHTLRNYLRICMPMTIEQQINSTVTIYQQGGMVALDRKDAMPLIDVRGTVGSAVIGNAGQQFQYQPPPVQNAQRLFMAQVQRSLCVQPANGNVGPATRAAIVDYMAVTKGMALKADQLDPFANDIRAGLIEASSDVSDCKSAGFKTAYEVAAYGVPKGDMTARITDLQKRAQTLLKEKKSIVTIQVTGKFDPQTRDAIPELRKQLGLPSNRSDVDAALREKIGEILPDN
jgi:hypothetical protein